MINSEIKVVINRSATNGVSPYRLIHNGNGVEQANEYLDSLAARGLSEKTMSGYAYDLLIFWRWFIQTNINFENITKKTLIEYIQYQRQDSSPAATTINRRLTVLECFYHYCFNKHIPARNSLLKEESFPSTRSIYRVGWLHPFRVKYSTKVKVPRHNIVPLTQQEVFQFFSTFKTWRDIAITGFMLFCGLRRNEVISLKLNNIEIAQNQVRVLGKGNKERLLPLPKDLLITLDKYLNLERPEKSSEYLFVVLKGPHRGYQMTTWAIRTIFSYHRKISDVSKANPHRFRHTFGSDMVMAGISLPILMRLMGHADIQTTMRYVNISVQDIQEEFRKAVTKLQTKEVINGTATNF